MGSGPEAVINYKGFTTKYLQPAFPHITFDSVKISALFSKMSQNCSEFLIQLQIPPLTCFIHLCGGVQRELHSLLLDLNAAQKSLQS